MNAIDEYLAEVTSIMRSLVPAPAEVPAFPMDADTTRYWARADSLDRARQ